MRNKLLAVALFSLLGSTLLVAVASAGSPVTPGAFCSASGRVGVASNGKKYVCSASRTDRRKRWRSINSITQKTVVPSVPSGASESSTQPPDATTTTSTTTTTIEPAVIATQIVDLSLGRNYDSPYNGKSYMRQEVELQIKADARSLPLSVCWDVKADGSKIPWWHWYQFTAVAIAPSQKTWQFDSEFIWELPKNERGYDIMGTGCWSSIPRKSATPEAGGLTAVIRVDYREPDLYYPTPYRPRFFQIRARVIDATGFTINSATLEFEK